MSVFSDDWNNYGDGRKAPIGSLKMTEVAEKLRALLEKQKKGKKRMRQIGEVEIPQSAFIAALKMDNR